MELLWNPAWETGIFLIDKQHRQMFAKAVEMFEDIKAQKEVRHEILEAFIHEYVKVHFSTEESYMRDIRYPAYASHKEAHELLYSKANNFSSPALHEDVFGFIVEWLIDHINTHDRTLATFIRSKSISSLEPTGVSD